MSFDEMIHVQNPSPPNEDVVKSSQWWEYVNDPLKAVVVEASIIS